jgi:hypothetical protein
MPKLSRKRRRDMEHPASYFRFASRLSDALRKHYPRLDLETNGLPQVLQL